MLSIDPIQSTQLAGLRYVSDDTPGIRRKRAGRGFVYVGMDGKPIRNPEELKRFKSLIIPPAWTDVWICPLPDGHLQATGRDAKGRKQYRYHPQWSQIRNQTKFEKMIHFGSALPLIRETTDQHLKGRNLGREKVLATVVQLLEKTLIRVGNTEYAEKNRSFGLTTLRNRHIEITGATLRFRFRGKSGVDHEIELGDRRLAKIVRRCQELPGHELFQYLDEEGNRQTIDSKDVNTYLKEITGEEFTAKDFRTWAGTVKALQELQDIGEFTSQTEAKKNVTQVVKTVAHQLGNRPATCRKYYIHPAILESYLEGNLPTLIEKSRETLDESLVEALQPEESLLLALLNVGLAETSLLLS